MHHVTWSPRATLAATEFFIIDLMWFPCLAVPLPCQLALYHSLSRPRGLTGRESTAPFVDSHHASTKPFPVFRPPPRTTTHPLASALCSHKQTRPLDKRVVRRSMYWRWLSATIKLHNPLPPSVKAAGGAVAQHVYVCFGRRRCGVEGWRMTVWEAESVPLGFCSASSAGSFWNGCWVSDGRSQPADLSTGCISSP